MNMLNVIIKTKCLCFGKRTNKKRLFFDLFQNPILNLKNVINTSLNIILFQDKNKNGKWDSGDVKKAIQPEKLIRKELKLEGVQGLYTISL